MTTFFRLLHTDDKDSALRHEIAEPGKLTFQVDPVKFAMVPGSPFAYWVSDRIRRLFRELPPFESEGRTVKQGLATADDFRFVRCWWEVDNAKILDGQNGPNWRKDLPAFQAWCRQRTFDGKRWVPFAKGGEYSPFYADLHLVVNWERDGQEMKEHVCKCYPYLNGKWGFVVKNTDYYFRSGLTWPLRSQVGLTLRCNPAGGIFGHKGPVGNPIPKMESGYLAIMNSEPFRLCVGLQMAFGSYEVGVIQRTPVPNHLNPKLGTLALQAVDIQRTPEQTNEISHLFVHPFIPLIPEAERQAKLAAVQAEIDELAFEAYGLSAEEVSGEQWTACSEEAAIEPEEDDSDTAHSSQPTAICLLPTAHYSYAVGCVFGRWDIRYATGERPAPPLPDPFEPLPVCSPGMLQGDDGLPLRDSPPGYPLVVQWNGILVDDPDHPEDIVRQVQNIYDLLKNSGDVSRDYFRKPGKGGFWDDHISRYSKSRRKAPIYWLLQSSKKNYAIWLYYHQLDKDLLFKVLVNYIEPKIRLETSRLDSLQSQRADASGREARRIAKEVEKQEDFISELQNFEDKLRRTANLHLEPDLNDGVVLNIAPLWELVPWKEAKKYWDELMAGKYEWSSIGKQLRERGLVT